MTDAMPQPSFNEADLPTLIAATPWTTAAARGGGGGEGAARVTVIGWYDTRPGGHAAYGVVAIDCTAVKRYETATVATPAG